MKKSSPISIFVLVLLGAILAGGMAHLFQLRFAAGDIYPAYSSLRADPQGTRVLFESIEQLPEVEAVRNLRPLHRQEADAETTLLLTGVKRRLSRATVEEVQRILKSGARVVVSYYPFREEDYPDLRWLRLGSPAEAGQRGEEEREDEEDGRGFGANLGRTFGFELHFKEGPAERREQALTGLETEHSELSANRPPDFWFSRLYLKPNKKWEVLMTLGDEPVMMRRDYEGGTLVIVTDSYWLSNEAMRMTRRTGFVAWLLGSARTVIFDETHLGVMDHRRLSHLMRSLNLEALLGVLLILAILFIWKNGVAFPPREPAPESSGEGEVKGYDSQQGLVNLLRANIGKQRIGPFCWEEWLKTLEPAERIRLAPRIEAAEDAVKSREHKRSSERDMVNDYRKVATILNERKNVCKPQIQTSKD